MVTKHLLIFSCALILCGARTSEQLHYEADDELTEVSHNDTGITNYNEIKVNITSLWEGLNALREEFETYKESHAHDEGTTKKEKKKIRKCCKKNKKGVVVCKKCKKIKNKLDDHDHDAHDYYNHGNHEGHDHGDGDVHDHGHHGHDHGQDHDHDHHDHDHGKDHKDHDHHDHHDHDHGKDHDHDHHDHDHSKDHDHHDHDHDHHHDHGQEHDHDHLKFFKSLDTNDTIWDAHCQFAHSDDSKLFGEIMFAKQAGDDSDPMYLHFDIHSARKLQVENRLNFKLHSMPVSLESGNCTEAGDPFYPSSLRDSDNLTVLFRQNSQTHEAQVNRDLRFQGPDYIINKSIVAYSDSEVIGCCTIEGTNAPSQYASRIRFNG